MYEERESNWVYCNSILRQSSCRPTNSSSRASSSSSPPPTIASPPPSSHFLFKPIKLVLNINNTNIFSSTHPLNAVSNCQSCARLEILRSKSLSFSLLRRFSLRSRRFLKFC
ncbi:hypothetical protein U1Q18_026651, partial [Sarracenia purpurea var. burkii]